MIELTFQPHIKNEIETALIKAGKYEVGGIMMAEHVGVNRFEVRKITVQRKGGFASFIRKIEDAVDALSQFFKSTTHNYQKFNYIGEWHSHPSFSPLPSQKDDCSMLEIVQDEAVGANFVVLVIVKLDASKKVVGTAHVYLPDGTRHMGKLTL
jgi:proteasome lid subunit RPN8/RPN11